MKDVHPHLAQRGDIVGFGKTKTSDPKKIHIGVVKENRDGIQIMHASKESGTIEETQLDKIIQRKRHETLRFVKRPVVIFESREPNIAALQKLYFT